MTVWHGNAITGMGTTLVVYMKNFQPILDRL